MGAPWSWEARGIWVTAVCVTNHMGGTDVRATFMGRDIKPFTFDDYDISKDGFDNIRQRIETMVTDLVCDALEIVA